MDVFESSHDLHDMRHTITHGRRAPAMHLLHDEQPTAEHRFFFRFLRVRRKGYGVCHNLHAYRGLPPPNPRSAAARGYSSAARCSLFWRYDPRHAAPRRARTPAQRGGEPHKHECQGSGRGGGRGGARRDGRADGRAHAGCCCCSSASRRYDPRRAAPRRARTPAQRGEPHEHKCQGSGVRRGGVRGGGGGGATGGRAGGLTLLLLLVRWLAVRSAARGPAARPHTCTARRCGEPREHKCQESGSRIETRAARGAAGDGQTHLHHLDLVSPPAASRPASRLTQTPARVEAPAWATTGEGRE